MGSADPPGKMDEKFKSENMQKSSFLSIFRAMRVGRCRERRYADHIFIQIYFRMHHFVVKFFFASGSERSLTPLTKILRTPLLHFIYPAVQNTSAV